jgi:hypothetical protein
MNINIDYNELVNDDEKLLLKSILNCGDDNVLIQALRGISIAAINEYLEMILGKQIATRANEMQERRLYHLLKCYFVGRIPSEAEVSSFFQLNESSSRALIRNVKTKFKFNLEGEIQATMKSVLLSARVVGGNYRVVVNSESILEELRQTVSLKAAHLDQISKVKNSAGVYNIPEDTFAILCEIYGVDLAQIQVAAGQR